MYTNRFSLLEAFASPLTGSSLGDSAKENYSDDRIRAICTDQTLDKNRQTFISTLKDIIVKLSTIDATSASVNDRIAGYQKQLIRINQVNDALAGIVGFFNGDGSNMSTMQSLSDIVQKLVANQTYDSSYIDASRAILTQSEDVLKNLFSLSNKLDTIRNHMINFLNISSRSVSYARLLCLKRDFLDPALQTAAANLDSKLQTYIANLQTWCSKMAGVSFSSTCNNPPPGADICSQAPPSLSCSEDSCYQSFMNKYNPTALPNQWQDLKTCMTTGNASNGTSGQNTNCSSQWVYNGCVPYQGWKGVGPIASQSPIPAPTPPAPAPGPAPGPIPTPSPSPQPSFTGECLKLYNNCISAGGTPAVCAALAQDCTTSPTNYCPPQPPRCAPGIGDCPQSKMTFNSKNGEYEIASHPDINQWGVQNTVWGGGGSQWVPDYVAQKMGVDNRCMKLDDFDISKHKDIQNYVSKQTLDSMSQRASKLQNRLQTCQNAFQASSCAPPGTKTVEGFSDTSQDGCAIVDDPGMNFDITTHKQYPTILKSYTPNSQLPQVCPTILNCASYPIENNKDISKYVLRSSVPSPSKVSDWRLQDHPDFPTYQNTWKAKADLNAKSAKEAADNACQKQIASFASKDPCGNPMPCKALGDYKLQDHPEFSAFNKAWKDEFGKYAGRDKAGNIVKCQNPDDLSLDDIPAVAQLKADMHAQCQASITALGAVNICGQPAPCSALNDYDITQHKDFSKYVQKDSCLTPDKLNNYVPKDTCLTSDDFNSYDITRHPDIKKYVLRSSVPDQKSIKQYKRQLCRSQAACASQKAELQSTYEKKLDKYACKDKSGQFTTCPDMSSYVKRIDVKPCPPMPSDADIARLVKGNVSKYLDSSYMNKMCINAGFSTNDCAKRFVMPSNAGLEGFTSDNDGKYPERHPVPNDKWDVMLHKDYKYADQKGGHMPKQECYSTYATIGKDGKPLPCSQALSQQQSSCKKLGDYDIKQHPQYESTIVKFGAVKDKCGKLIPSPPCPCLARDQCGNLVPKPCPKHPNGKDDCELKKSCENTLMKEKLRFNILLARYKDLLKSVSTSQADKSKYESQLKSLNDQLGNLQHSISKADVEKPSPPQSMPSPPQSTPSPPQSPPRSCVQRIKAHTRQDRADDTDIVQPLAAARPNQHGWVYQ